ncbi:MAG: NUDIX domain-containing protein [Bacteroidia bacterium]|nr:NUDIX domain-containing protein [Bacteroidia bacterium]
MYKIFINDKPFIIANSAFTDNSFPSFDFEEKLFETKIAEVFANQFSGVVFKCNDEELVFNKFAKHFKIIEAAGGLVFNSKNQLLLIERLGVWDLPKGKIELGEIPEIAAVREVEEECAVTELTIENLVCKSYHTYFFKKKHILKRTYWYKMNTDFNKNLVPQTEEDITKVEWQNFTKNDIETLNTYKSIKDVLRKCFE